MGAGGEGVDDEGVLAGAKRRGEGGRMAFQPERLQKGEIAGDLASAHGGAAGQGVEMGRFIEIIARGPARWRQVDCEGFDHKRDFKPALARSEHDVRRARPRLCVARRADPAFIEARRRGREGQSLCWRAQKIAARLKQIEAHRAARKARLRRPQARPRASVPCDARRACAVRAHFKAQARARARRERDDERGRARLTAVRQNIARRRRLARKRRAHAPQIIIGLRAARLHVIERRRLARRLDENGGQKGGVRALARKLDRDALIADVHVAADKPATARAMDAPAIEIGGGLGVATAKINLRDPLLGREAARVEIDAVHAHATFEGVGQRLPFAHVLDPERHTRAPFPPWQARALHSAQAACDERVDAGPQDRLRQTRQDARIARRHARETGKERGIARAEAEALRGGGQGRRRAQPGGSDGDAPIGLGRKKHEARDAASVERAAFARACASGQDAPGERARRQKPFVVDARRVVSRMGVVDAQGRALRCVAFRLALDHKLDARRDGDGRWRDVIQTRRVRGERQFD